MLKIRPANDPASDVPLGEMRLATLPESDRQLRSKKGSAQDEV